MEIGADQTLSTEHGTTTMEWRVDLTRQRHTLAAVLSYVLDAVCCVYTCRRLIDLSLIEYVHAGD